MVILKALLTNLAILSIWYAFEYQEFGELQFRQCDNVVWCCYFIVLLYLFATQR